MFLEFLENLSKTHAHHGKAVIPPNAKMSAASPFWSVGALLITA